MILPRDLRVELCFAGDRKLGLLDCMTKTPFFCLIAHPRQIIHNILLFYITHWAHATQNKNSDKPQKSQFFVTLQLHEAKVWFTVKKVHRSQFLLNRTGLFSQL
jgi:hypothetical protein